MSVSNTVSPPPRTESKVALWEFNFKGNPWDCAEVYKVTAWVLVLQDFLVTRLSLLKHLKKINLVTQRNIGGQKSHMGKKWPCASKHCAEDTGASARTLDSDSWLGKDISILRKEEGNYSQWRMTWLAQSTHWGKRCTFCCEMLDSVMLLVLSPCSPRTFSFGLSVWSRSISKQSTHWW